MGCLFFEGGWLCCASIRGDGFWVVTLLEERNSMSWTLLGRAFKISFGDSIRTESLPCDIFMGHVSYAILVNTEANEMLGDVLFQERILLLCAIGIVGLYICIL